MPTPQEKLNKLKEISKLLDEGLTRTEFTTSFKKVLSVVASIKKQVIDSISTLNSIFKTTTNKLEKDFKDTIGKMEVKVDNKLNEVKDGIQGVQGAKGDTGEQGESIQGLNGADGSPDTPKIIRDKLEFLKKEKEKLSIDAIGYLEERLTDLEENGRKLGSKVSGGGLNMGAMNLRIVDPYTPKGDLDGTNKDFELVAAPSPATSLKVYRGGRLLKLTEDYTLSGTTVSLLIAPHADDSVTVEHRR